MADGTKKPKAPTGRYIVWRDGVPYPAYADPFTKEAFENIITSTMALEYETEKYIDPELGIEVTAPHEEKYRGMSNLEVMGRKLTHKAASGDMEAVKYVFDRVVGKPTTHIEQSGSIELKLQDHLRAFREEDKMLAEQQMAAIEDRQNTVDTEVIHVQTKKRVIDMDDM